MHEGFSGRKVSPTATLSPCIHFNTTEQLSHFKRAEDRGKTFSSRTSSKTWAWFVSGAKLNPEHWRPAVQPLCLQSPEIKTWKSGLMKYSESDIQGIGGGTYSFQKNRVGTAPRQGIAPFHRSGSHSNIWQNFTLMKKIVAEAKSKTKEMWFLFFHDRSALLSFLLYIFSEQQLSVQLCSGDVCACIKALHPCVSLWIQCCSLIPQKPSLALCTCSQCH